jgi:hypothetical protein
MENVPSVPGPPVPSEMKMSRGAVIVVIVLFILAINLNAKSWARTKYSAIVIEYNGSPDKPYEPIVISDSKAGAKRQTALLRLDAFEHADVEVVSASLMAKLMADAELSRPTAIPGSRDRLHELEAFAITLVTPQRNSVLLLDPKSGCLLLDRLEKDIVDNKALQWHLSQLRCRFQP